MSKWTIGRKLTVSFVGILALLAAMSYASLNAISTLKSSFDIAAEKTARKISLTGRFDTSTSDMEAAQRGLIMRALAGDSAPGQQMRQDFRRAAEAATTALAEIKPLLITDEGRQIHSGLSSQLAEWIAGFAEVDRLCSAGKAREALDFATARLLPLYDQTGEGARRMVELLQRILAEDRADASAQIVKSRWIAIALIGLGLGFGGVTLFIIRGVSLRLKNVAGHMMTSAVQVASAAAQVSSASQELAKGASEQAASLEETSASSEQISATAKTNAENSQAAAKLVEEAGRQMNEANDRLREMLASMQEIH